MQYPLFDFLCPSLIPKLRSNITAGAPCHEQLLLVAVTAVWTLPYELAAVILDDLYLAVVAAALAEIAFCI